MAYRKETNRTASNPIPCTLFHKQIFRGIEPWIHTSKWDNINLNGNQSIPNAKLDA